IDAARAGKPDAALCQFVPRKLVGAGTDRLDKTEFRRAVEKTVLPQTRDHQHLGLANPFLQGLKIAGGEAVDASIEGREPLTQPVSDMGKADRKFIVGGKHGPAPSHTKRLVISSSAACRTLTTRHRVFAGLSTSI